MRLRRPDPHGWNSWPSYLAAHEGRLGDFEHFILEDRLTSLLGVDTALWRGELICADGYEIHVRRTQIAEMRQGGVPWVKTSLYKYHAVRRRPDATRNLFRYDNVHPHADHPTPHHRHRYVDGVERLPVEHVGESGWPNLGQVVEELHVYWERRLG